MTRLQAGRLNNHGSIPSKSKIFSSSPQHLDLYRCHQASYSVSVEGCFLGGKEAGEGT